VLYLPLTGPGTGLPFVDKAVHLLVFAAVALCGRRSGVPTLVLLGALALHAGISELVHASVPALGRDGDPWDAVADVAGAALGFVVAGRGLPGADKASGERMRAWTSS
jgi:hypothetical protein